MFGSPIIAIFSTAGAVGKGCCAGEVEPRWRQRAAEVAPWLQCRVLGELDRGGGGLRSADTVCRMSREGEDARYFTGVEPSFYPHLGLCASSQTCDYLWTEGVVIFFTYI
jgi:hypothetical protein